MMKQWSVFGVPKLTAWYSLSQFPPQWCRMVDTSHKSFLSSDDPPPHPLSFPSSRMSLGLFVPSPLSSSSFLFYLSVGGWTEPRPCRRAALRDWLAAHRGRRDRARLSEEGKLKELKSGGKVGGSMVGKIRLMEWERSRWMGPSLNVCVHACVRKTDKE